MYADARSIAEKYRAPPRASSDSLILGRGKASFLVVVHAQADGSRLLMDKYDGLRIVALAGSDDPLLQQFLQMLLHLFELVGWDRL